MSDCRRKRATQNQGRSLKGIPFSQFAVHCGELDRWGRWGLPPTGKSGSGECRGVPGRQETENSLSGGTGGQFADLEVPEGALAAVVREHDTGGQFLAEMGNVLELAQGDVGEDLFAAAGILED